MLALAFSAAALFTYVSGSSFVLRNLYGVSPARYSLIFATNAVGMLLAGASFGALSRRFRLNTLLGAAIGIAGTGALLQVLLPATVGGTLAGTWACLFVTLFGVGMILPAGMSLGQALGRDASGAASALLGGAPFLFGALASPLVGVLGAAVADGQYLAALGTGGSSAPDATTVYPARDPFNTWVQTGAIFRRAKHKAAAKLFLSWITSQSFQKQGIATWTWSVRKDVAPPTGLRPLADYKQTSVNNFSAFMANRAAVEQFRAQVQLYVGEVQGADPADPAGSLGRTPGGF